MADERFSALSTDPRYRLPSRKEARTAVDPRFKRLFTDQDFGKKASVDRYGRKIKSERGRKELERLYRLDKKGDRNVELKEDKKPASEENEDDENEDEELAGKGQTLDGYDPARDGGFSSSSDSDSDSDLESESEAEADLAELTAGQEHTEDVPMGEVSSRLAAVNLDWDNIRAEDLMAVAASFAPSGGQIRSVNIYPSEFGRERLEREALEGPPREIFASSSRTHADTQAGEEGSSESQDDEDAQDAKIKKQLLQADDGHEFDHAALRQYQLERLRYHYAVLTCDSAPTAKALYDNMDGREYLSSANFFDLRFVPEGVSFAADDPRDTCDALRSGYAPNEFRTEALTHSKVRLTWDDDDTARQAVQKRAFSRLEMDENDLQAYIGSESSGAESATSVRSARTAQKRREGKQEAKRSTMRAALGLTEGARAGKEEAVGELQVTFSAALSKKADRGVFENEPQDEESTRQRYVRKERERKQRRKDKAQAARLGNDTATEHSSTAPAVAGAAAAEDGEEHDPFDDPFFNDPATAAESDKTVRKAERRRRRSEKAAAGAEAEARKAELELLMADDGQDGVRHFDMREVVKAEKAERRKKGRKAEAGEESGGFAVDAQDPRFGALFESHEYAIDPTSARFKGTEGMKALLEEGRRRRKQAPGEDGEGSMKSGGKTRKKMKRLAEGRGAGDVELEDLVARVKGKGKL